MKNNLLLMVTCTALSACTLLPQQKNSSQNHTSNNSTPPVRSPPLTQKTDPARSLLNSAQQLAQGLQRAFNISNRTADRLAPIIIQQARQYKVSPFLLAALIMQESSYRSNVKSSAGAIGLTQVIPKYWQSQCKGSLWQESHNIQCGSYILSIYNKQAGHWFKALAYYNVGPSAYNSSQKMQQLGKKYAKSVTQHHQALLISLNLIKDPHL